MSPDPSIVSPEFPSYVSEKAYAQCFQRFLLKPSSAMRNFHIFLLFFVVSCSSEQGSGVCSYINAFGDSVNHSYFTSRNGQDDASKFAQNDRVGFIGGYLVTGPFTPVISGENSGIPLEFNRVFDKFGWNIEKLYLTDSLRNMKKGDFRSFDYGIRDGVQVDRDCYDKQLRDYAAAFNKAMLGRVL